MHTRIVILAGGVSSRMKKSEGNEALTQEDIDQANARSKGLIGVGENGRPFLDYLLYNIKRAGYKEVYIVISPKDDLFPSFYTQGGTDAGILGDMSVQFALQHVPEDRIKPAGTADALFQALEQYPSLQSGPFTVCNSDNLYSEKALVELGNSLSPNALISYDRDYLQFPPDTIARFAVMKVDSNGFLIDIVEKPAPDQIDNYKDQKGLVRVNMNAFKFEGSMFFAYLRDCPLDPVRNEKELPTAMLNMIKDHPGSVLAIPFSEHVPDLTAKEDIAAVRAYLTEHFKDYQWTD